jgi:hypothetical protein
VRVRFSELTPRRVGEALARRVRAVPDRLAWLGPAGRANRARLTAFRDKHRGERCYVLGNGPSLAKTDLGRLRDVTFGANRIYLLHQPTYFTCVNELVLEQFQGDIAALPCPTFLNWDRRGLFGDRAQYVCLAMGLEDRFGADVTEPIASGGTVTFVALELAYYMGFHEVVLLGVDHSFVDKGTPNRTETRTASVDANHFHPSYFPQGSKWQLPDLHRSELAYARAREAFERAGRRIVDATIGGQCPVFVRARFVEVT